MPAPEASERFASPAGTVSGRAGKCAGSACKLGRSHLHGNGATPTTATTKPAAAATTTIGHVKPKHVSK